MSELVAHPGPDWVVERCQPGIRTGYRRFNG